MKTDLIHLAGKMTSTAGYWPVKFGISRSGEHEFGAVSSNYSYVDCDFVGRFGALLCRSDKDKK